MSINELQGVLNSTRAMMQVKFADLPDGRFNITSIRALQCTKGARAFRSIRVEMTDDVCGDRMNVFLPTYLERVLDDAAVEKIRANHAVLVKKGTQVRWSLTEASQTA